jgi:hypothetical protein
MASSRGREARVEEKTRILIIGKNDKEVKFLDTKKNNF